ncbi:MAG: hypothetical protein K2W99_07905 [Chthoniobacterales bacterium]|nr:hypothetical protein [Chthoniobacterales bacterium]
MNFRNSYLLQLARSSEARPFWAAFGSRSNGCYAACIFLVRGVVVATVTLVAARSDA